MNTADKMKNAVRLIVALIKGDDAEAKALKNLAKFDSYLKAEIALKNAHRLDLEQNVTDAKEKAALALVNKGEDNFTRESYINGLIKAEDAIAIAKEALQDHDDVVKLLKRKLAELDEES